LILRNEYTMKPTNLYPRALSCSIALLLAFSSAGQETMFQTFQATPDLSLTIIAEWDTVRNLYGDDEYKATTQFNDTEWKSELKLRGRNRRKRCDSTLTPLRLQFKKKELRAAGLKEMRNHKIVTCCIENAAGLENLQEEILVYQLYEILTDQSFRSVEAELTMKWPDDEYPEKASPVLIIEPNKELVDRLGGTEIEEYNHPADSLNAECYNRTALFQFMVGNFDWDQTMQTNIKMIRVDSKALIVPYDFDFSAIVSPSYARLPADLGLKNFKDRIYLGQYFLDQLPEMEAYFISKKDELYEHVLNFEGLKKYRRKQITKYLDIFFDFIEDPDTTITYKTILPFD
jgi:hypothetical protein